MEMGATEGFMKYQIEQLEEENKKLKEDLAFERTMLDNVRAEYESSQKLIRKLREELSKKSMEAWFDKKSRNMERL